MSKKNYVYLSYSQVCILILKINEIKNMNPNRNYVIVNSFINYVQNRSVEIYLTPKILFKIDKYADKYKISKTLLEYLIKFTKIDLYDKQTYNSYLKIINNLELELLSDSEEFKNNVKKSLRCYIN